MSPRALALALPLLAALACVSPPTGAREEPESPAAAEGEAPRSYAPVLYARDGTPVDAGGARSREPEGAPPLARELAGDSGGRMYILELYQNVIEERDRLSLEVDALGTELERAKAALNAADQRIAELERALEAAAAESQRQKAENVDLAGRLATAQIRRLQAEKILLELRLAEIEAAERGAEHP